MTATKLSCNEIQQYKRYLFFCKKKKIFFFANVNEVDFSKNLYNLRKFSFCAFNSWFAYLEYYFTQMEAKFNSVDVYLIDITNNTKLPNEIYHLIQEFL
jgi:hypothetical protein